jgi:small subunit ribosomal protein S8
VLRIRLKYLPDGAAAIRGLERVSRPGRRIYRGKDEIPKVLNGLGVVIVSTPAGVLTGSSCRRRGLGGEVLCNVW